MQTREITYGIIARLTKDLEKLERTLTVMENVHTPTFPRKTPVDDLGIEGQFVVGDDDVVYAFSNGVWLDANA